jgi:hypothetical protein
MVGVVRQIGPPSGTTDRFVLDTGEVFLNTTRAEGIYPEGGGSPRIGDLLIVGDDGGKEWYVIAARGPDSAKDRPCFQLWATGVDRVNSIDTSIGIRFTKAGDFDPGPDTNGIYDEQPHAFCLDERGVIYRWV